MLVGSTRLQDIVGWQAGNGWLLLFQMLGFVLFLVSAFAETNRAPFDLPEAEQELVAGFLTEYSAIKWALYQMAEYISMFTASAMMVTLFFGGWKGPQFLNGLIPGISEWPIVWFIAKMAFFVFFFIWVKASILRIRYDQLMRFGWKLVLPLALINTVLTAFYIAYFKASWGLWPLVLGSLIGVGLLIYFSDAVRSLWNTPGIRRAEDLSPRAHTVTPANRQTLGGD
jgi:NADH-quinone oxidoreductase subunit H